MVLLWAYIHLCTLVHEIWERNVCMITLCFIS
jgi:hypothetical protein